MNWSSFGLNGCVARLALGCCRVFCFALLVTSSPSRAILSLRHSSKQTLCMTPEAVRACELAKEARPQEACNDASFFRRLINAWMWCQAAGALLHALQSVCVAPSADNGVLWSS